MKTILVPLDFSIQSEHAIKLASKIANKTDIKVFLLHMIKMPEGHVDMSSGSHFGIPQSMHYIQKATEKILHLKAQFFNESITVKYAIRFDPPYDGILKFSARVKPDLIIMGSKDKSIIDELLVGALAKKVAKESKIPILAINKDPKNLKIKELVFVSDFEEESRKSFEVLLDFTQKFESKIHLLNVNTMSRFKSTKKAKQKMNAFLLKYKNPKHSINVYNDDSVEKGVLNFSKEVNADLIALSAHERSGISRLFNKSISKSISKKTLKPVFTFFI
ncbi:MAG: nucleotide-binding universal stress UspA family protein [Polaribacter sp.]|jgi:nucleotide-binding universal stress UspA family protein